MGGDDITELVHGATGVDLVDCQVRQCVGEKMLQTVRDVLDAPREPRAEAIWFAAPPPVGELVEVLGATRDVTVSAAPGTQFTGLVSSYSRPAHARAGAATAEEAVRLAREAIDALTFVTRVPAARCLP
jgi:hypothetical protein